MLQRHCTKSYVTNLQLMQYNNEKTSLYVRVACEQCNNVDFDAAGMAGGDRSGR